ncbi:MAG TPA: 5-formyltetrahydrofolate cyclo-ligase [Mycobacteriales bacterium]
MYPPEPDAEAAKRFLRQEMLARRRARPEADRAAADAALLDVLLEELHAALPGQPPGTPPVLVAAYVPVGTEPGGPGLPGALRAAGYAVLLPVLQPDGDLDWALHTGDLVPGPRGLLEPAGPRHGPGAVRDAAAVVVPAVAVDRRGVRLGRGGGSYDRALARVPPPGRVVALLYDGEVLDTVPAEPHDRRVTTVVTPAGVHPCE